MGIKILRFFGEIAEIAYFAKHETVSFDLFVGKTKMKIEALFFLLPIICLFVYYFFNMEDLMRWELIGFLVVTIIISFLYYRGLLH